MKIKAKRKKGLRLAPKKRSFKVKSLTKLPCAAVGIGKHMDVSFAANYETELLQPKGPPQKLRLEVFHHHQLTP